VGACFHEEGNAFRPLRSVEETLQAGRVNTARERLRANAGRTSRSRVSARAVRPCRCLWGSTVDGIGSCYDHWKTATRAWCSVSEIDWSGRGFEGTKLGYLIGRGAVDT